MKMKNLYSIIDRREFLKDAAQMLVASALPVSFLYSVVKDRQDERYNLPGGFWPVMITPFKADLEIDYKALKEMISWYEEAGAAGFFANCGSSEMFHLKDEERIHLTEFVVENSAIPVVSTGTFFDSHHRNSAYIRQIYQTGVDGVVLIPGVLVREKESDEELLRSIQRILDDTGDIPLGLYECPSPYHRLISPELLSELAPTGRFVYFKNTFGNEVIVDQKIEAGLEDGLGIYNAVSSDALHSIRNGGAGISPIAGNFYPELYAYLWLHGKDEDFAGEVEEVHSFILENESVIGHKYPLSSKYFMRLRGLDMHVNTRKQTNPLNQKEKDTLTELWTALQALADTINIELA